MSAVARTVMAEKMGETVIFAKKCDTFDLHFVICDVEMTV